MLAALKVINDSLFKSSSAASGNLTNANKIVQKEWFQISSTESANPNDVEDYLDCFEEYSSELLRFVVNSPDSNVRPHSTFKKLKIITFKKIVGQHSNALRSVAWQLRRCVNSTRFPGLQCKSDE